MDIKTTRLHIRDLIEADWPVLHALRTDPAVYRFNHFGPESVDATQRWIKATMHYNQQPARDSHNCLLLLRTTGQVIGWIGFGSSSPREASYGDVDFGYALLPAFWGQGYMTEALAGMLNFIFTTTTANRVCATCNVGNIGSARVMEKAGMRRIAHFANPEETSPDKAASYRYQIDRQTWETLQRKGK